MQPFPRSARGVLCLAWVLCALSLRAQPSLSTIEDTVFRADGQRFDGIAMIEWRSFLASDNSSIAAFSKNVRIISGVLKVTLVPTTTASTGAYYVVKYSNNGRILFTEYWGVRPSATSLRLADVRLVGPPVGGSPVGLPPAGSGVVQITDVVGLTDELAARAKKGLAYTPSHAAVINATGDLESANGQPTDCLRVNGTTGPCTAGSTNAFVDAETPAGLMNGTNGTFTLSNPPAPSASLQLYNNGVLQRPNADFTLTGNTIAFNTGSIPQTGDQLLASYRIAGVGGDTGGEAGGALSGFFPAPSIAPGAISNTHIAPSAGIVESKLALNFPTHSSSNDPTPEQKSALTGTSGSPSNTNRFVTDQDSRMTNSRAPSGHALLGGGHYDSNPGVVTRGDLIIGMGTSPALWSRLTLGAPNRCLISNGFDAVWNACLFTGFPNGSIPFVDGSGNLAQNNSMLFWDNSTRRLGVGMNTPASTMTVQDSASSVGQTTLVVRSGDGQASAPLQRWQNFTSSDLARVESDGQLMAAAVRATSTSSRAAWQETGSTADPSSPSDGNAWLNTTEVARKSFEAGQAHIQPQVTCSKAGTSTSSLTLTSLGKCHIPVEMLRAGDRFEILFDVSHQGTTSAFSYSLNWGSTVLTARSTAGTEAGANGRADALPGGTNLNWGWQSWGTSAAVLGGNGSSSSIPAGAIDVELFGQMATSTSDTITLRNLTVIRIPALSN